MAKVQNPVIGRTRGSAGGMTFAKVYDKNVMKAKVFEASNPNTAAQQVQRSYWKTVSAQSAVLTPDQLRAIFPNKPKAMSRRNALTQQLAEYWQMNGSTKEMKLSDLVTVGNAKTMDMGTTTAAVAGTAVTVTLSDTMKANTLLGDNYFVAMLVNDTQNLIYLDITSEKVSVGAISVNLPAGWDVTDTVHAIPLVTDSKTAVTAFGTLSVNERPARP
jgi:hypothetical protein